MTDEQVQTINDELAAIETEIAALARQYRVYAKNAVKNRNLYDVAKAKKLLEIKTKSDLAGIKMTVDELKANVTLAVEIEMVAARESETTLDCCQKEIQAVNNRLSSVQTRARLLQTEANLTNYK